MSILHNTLQKIETKQIPVDWIDYLSDAFRGQVANNISDLLVHDFTSEYGDPPTKKSPVPNMCRVRSYVEWEQRLHILFSYFQNSEYIGSVQVEEPFRAEDIQKMERILAPLHIHFHE